MKVKHYCPLKQLIFVTDYGKGCVLIGTVLCPVLPVIITDLVSIIQIKVLVSKMTSTGLWVFHEKMNKMKENVWLCLNSSPFIQDKSCWVITWHHRCHFLQQVADLVTEEVFNKSIKIHSLFWMMKHRLMIIISFYQVKVVFSVLIQWVPMKEKVTELEVLLQLFYSHYLTIRYNSFFSLRIFIFFLILYKASKIVCHVINSLCWFIKLMIYIYAVSLVFSFTIFNVEWIKIFMIKSDVS